MQFIHTEHLFAQCDITVHMPQSAVDAVDQAVADSRFHIALIHSRFKCRRVFPCARIEDLLLDLTVIEGRPCILEFAVAGIKLLKDFFSQLSVRRHLQGHEASVGDRDLISVAVCDGREFEIRVSQHAESIERCLRHLAGRCQKLFHLLIQCVVFPAADLTDRDIVLPDSRHFLIKALHHGLRNRKDLRLHIGQFFADPDLRALDLELQFLIVGIARILVKTHEGISPDAVQFQDTFII